MRNLVRPAIPVVAAVLIILGGASTALAAAEPSHASLDASWCFQDGATEYCFEVDGVVHYLDTRVGSTVTINEITRTTVYESGEYAGEAMSVTMDRGEFLADGSVVIDTVVHTRSSVGDDDCTYHMVLRLADYEAVVYQVTSTCGA